MLSTNPEAFNLNTKDPKILITGYSGFVSHHFLEYLDKNEPYASIKGLDVQKPGFSHSSYKNIRLDFEKIDLLHQDRVESIITNWVAQRSQ